MRKTSLIVVLWLMCLVAIARPEPKAPVPTKFDLQAIDAFLASQAQEQAIVGLSFALVRDGRVVFARGYGNSSLEKAERTTTNTLFAIGSVTKQFVCACILLLAEDGKLSVDDKVSKYFSNLTRAEHITLLDLMQHVSGYPDYYPLDFVDRRMKSAIAVDELIRQYAGGKLDFEPGTRWSYSNTGYTILGRIVEKASGEKFGDFLKRRIFDPLEMKHTVFEPAQSFAGLAQGYTSFALSPPEPAQPEGDGWLYSAGGIYSTALDLAKWDLALVEGKVLKPESYQLMTAPRKLANGKLTGYGCGLGVVQRDGYLILSHGGAVNGFAARNVIVPANRSAIIMLSNTDVGGGFAKLYNTVLSLLLQSPSTVPQIRGASAADAARELFHRLQSGDVDRSQLGEEFNIFLDTDKVRGASKRLKAFGKPTTVEVEELRERGGMEVATIRFNFRSGTLKGLMYRSPDGKIQQFFVQND
jgi:D-alanyl-D-alanine carboxypeptidase